MILGIDEVGRGCWAGPLVVGAVVLGGTEIPGLTDSKALTKKRREALYDEIYAQAGGVGLGWVSASELDEVGLSAALCLATKRAVQAVGSSFHEIIIDGTVNFLRQTPLEAHVALMKKADLLVPSVSAASIVAKVARDRYMAERDVDYAGYGFASHAGYGTAAHRAAIAKLGVTPEHRLSFAPLAQYRNSASISPPEQVQGSDPCTGDVGSAIVTTRRIGDMSEAIAADELERRGHVVLERNWKTKYCEIDIVSLLGDVYFFTEVKHRADSRAGDGLAAITAKKLNQMRYAAKFYSHVNKLSNSNLRLAAISTTGNPPVLDRYIEIK